MKNTKQTPTQIKQIKKHFANNLTITSWEAISKYHITRLASIINRLKRQGWDITGKWHKNKNGQDFYVYTAINN